MSPSKIKTKVDPDFQKFVLAVRVRAMDDRNYLETPPGNRTSLIMVLNKMLANSKHRVRVLQLLTGLPLSSQKEMTLHYTEVLKDELTTNIYATKAIAYAERIVEEHPYEETWKIWSTDRLQAGMSELL